MAELTPIEISHLTKDLTDAQKMLFQSQYQSEKKDSGTAVILALLMYDRIWLGDTTLGIIIKICTMGGCVPWQRFDTQYNELTMGWSGSGQDISQIYYKHNKPRNSAIAPTMSSTSRQR